MNGYFCIIVECKRNYVVFWVYVIIIDEMKVGILILMKIWIEGYS